MRFLVFQHVPHEHPGLITDFAQRNNITLDIIEMWKEFRLPNVLDYDALIVMGGPMGVYDGREIFPSKDDELTAIKSAVCKMPILGHCLGSQLIAHALGAKVYPNIVGGKHQKEIGYYDVKLTSIGETNPLFAGFPKTFKVLQWHGDAFDLTGGAKLLATSELCLHQAFEFDRAFGVLFHFEFTPEMIAKQIEIDRGWIHRDFEMDETKLLNDAQIYAGQMKKQCDMLLTNFVKLIK